MKTSCYVISNTSGSLSHSLPVTHSRLKILCIPNLFLVFYFHASFLHSPVILHPSKTSYFPHSVSLQLNIRLNDFQDHQLPNNWEKSRKLCILSENEEKAWHSRERLTWMDRKWRPEAWSKQNWERKIYKNELLLKTRSRWVEHTQN